MCDLRSLVRLLPHRRLAEELAFALALAVFGVRVYGPRRAGTFVWPLASPMAQRSIGVGPWKSPTPSTPV